MGEFMRDRLGDEGIGLQCRDPEVVAHDRLSPLRPEDLAGRTAG